MKIGLIGYGRMGREVERIALARGHSIVQTFDKRRQFAAEPANNKAEVFIDFSVAKEVVNNIKAACILKRPVIVGTTGWDANLAQVKSLIEKEQGTVLVGANFSLGVALFARILKDAVKMFATFPEYEVALHETHHSMKLDAPSGTAIMLANEIKDYYPEVPITSTRVGKVPGIHSLIFDSDVDTIEFMHTARTRAGFAFGAVRAAEWIAGKQGFYTVDDMMNDLLRKGEK
jgi:4-hydroxy-tetrahydrodipicolinate reductase